MFLDTIVVMNQIDCGQHTDLCCYTEHPGHVKWLDKLRRQISDQQLEQLLRAICCASECGLASHHKQLPQGNEIGEAWWWWNK